MSFDSSEPFGPFTADELAESFAEFDVDKNGFIGANDLKLLYASLGETLSEAELKEMIQMCDSSGDGQIALKEFTELIGEHMEDAIELGFRKPATVESTATRMPAIASTHASQATGSREPGVDDLVLPSARWLTRADSLMPLEMEPLVAKGTEEKREDLETTDSVESLRFGKPLPAVDASDETESSSVSGSEAQTNAQRRADRAVVIHGFLTKLGIQRANFRDLNSKWLALDTADSGRVDYAAFCRGLAQPSERNPMCEALFSVFDRKRNGSIDFREFLICTVNLLSVDKRQKAQFAFEIFDLDGNGVIDANELRTILKATHLLSDSALETRAAAIMRHADADSGEGISLQEFENVCHCFPNLVFPTLSI